jgi:hypothetical protein
MLLDLRPLKRTPALGRMHKREILRGDASLRGKAVAPLAPPPPLETL